MSKNVDVRGRCETSDVVCEGCGREVDEIAALR
jgi:predicted Fe-S protein YdhL (DUF1289 family)